MWSVAVPRLLCLLALSAPDGHPFDRAAALLAEAVPRVEKACGATFDAPPRVVVLSSGEAEEVFARDLGPQVIKLYPQAAPAQIRTLIAIQASSSVRSCVARYSTTRKAVVLVRSGFDRQAAALGLTGKGALDLLRAALAHEAVHALDDARFDIAALYRVAPDREALRAVSMVVEGRAVHFGRSAPLPGGKEPDVRDRVLRLTYELGARFTARLVERGGLELADRAMKEPPALTHYVCQPDRWPDGETDERPAKLLAAAFPEARPEPLSELLLRARYADLDGPDAAEKLFAGYRGGVSAIVSETNLAVLAFADEAAAKAFAARSAKDVPVHRKGTLVVRAAGPAGEKLVAKVGAALAD